MSFFSQCIDSVKRRRWEHIRSKWISHVPYFATPGERPRASVTEITGFSEIATRLQISANTEFEKIRATADKTTPPNIKLITVEDEISGLREAIFAESLFLLHKSRHVLGTVEFQAVDGFHTWALANAYQSAFFAAKAILGFLGISFPEYNSKTVAIDIFPNQVTRSDEYSYCAFHFIGTRLDHRPVWEMFQRCVSVSVVDIWPKRLTNKLKSTESKKFAKQRNDIHYRNIGWLLQDLHVFDLDQSFGNVDAWNEGLDFDRADVSVSLALCLLKLGLMLLRDLERSTAKLSPEIQLLAECVSNGRHPKYGEFLIT